MKRFLFFSCLLFWAASNYAFTYEYWNGELYKGGPKVNDLMSAYPTYDHDYIQLSKQYITDGSLDFSTSFVLRWDNFHRKLALNHYWATWYIVGFRYQRSVYVAPNGTDNYTEIVSLRVDDGYLDVSNNVVWAENHIDLSSYSSQANSVKFYETMNADVKKLTKNREYKLKVVYMFTPSAVAEHDNYHYDSAETERYIRTQKIQLTLTQTGVPAVFKVAQVQTNSVINVNGYQNPFYNTGSGHRYIVYDSPDAIISVIADTVNLPVSKTVVSGTSNYEKTGYGTFLASIGANAVPTDIGKAGDEAFSGCGLYSSYCSKACNGIKSPYIAFLGDIPNHKNFLNSHGYDVTSSCYRTFTNVLKRSTNADMTDFSENTVSEFSENNALSYRMSKIFHLRDFSHVSKYTGYAYGAGSILKIQNSSSYTEKSNLSNDIFRNILALGYEPYGPSYVRGLAKGSDITSNVLEFEVVSAVTIPELTDAEMAERMTCVTDLLERDGDFIHLKGKPVSCGNYSPTLYAPVYMWEVSLDDGEWETITTENFSRYIIDRYNVNFAITMDAEKDLLLRSSILKKHSKAKFRQMVILKSFESDEESSLYHYKEDGKYYIDVHQSSFYTYIPTPIIDRGNIELTPADFPVEQRLCKGDELTFNKIKFHLVRSVNVPQDVIEKLEDLTSYKVYELNGETVGKLVSNTNSYTMNFNGEDISYRLVVSWCRDSVYKDVHVYVNPEEKIELESITSDVVISTIDTQKSQISMLCQSGGRPSISVGDLNARDCEYSYRYVVPFVEPEVTVTDFSKMSRSKLSSFINNRGWNYQVETGVSVENAGLADIRDWCRIKEDQENVAFIENERLENEKMNEWMPFDDVNSVQLKDVGVRSRTETVLLHKQNKTTLCESPEVKLTIDYFDGIENNFITPSVTSNVFKDTIYVPLGSKSPAINGSAVSGGYGGEYSYRYIYKTKGYGWSTLQEEGISLPENALYCNTEYQVARIAYSRKNGDALTEVSDTSNVLYLRTYSELDLEDVYMSGNGKCAGTEIHAGVPNYDPVKEVADVTRFVWSTSDPNLKILTEDIMDRQCIILNTTSSFDLYVYRENLKTGVKTRTVKVPVEVVTVTPYFSIKVGEKEVNIFDYPDEIFTFQSGTRFELLNSSTDADRYLWNLELQYYTGTEISGLTSYVENPVCYLYNQGQNKIRLTAMNALGCYSSITAENIYIQASSLRGAEADSFFAEDEQANQHPVSEQVFDVYPTVTIGTPVKAFYSGGDFVYTVYNSIGHVMAEGSASFSVEIPFDVVAAGLYTVRLVPCGEAGCDSNSRVFKIIRR